MPKSEAMAAFWQLPLIDRFADRAAAGSIAVWPGEAGASAKPTRADYIGPR